MNKKKLKLDSLFADIGSILENSSDAEILELLGDGILDKFLKAIAKPKSSAEKSIYEYLLKNKSRLTVLSIFRHAIQMNYSIKGIVNNTQVFVSPHYVQWYEDGVMFLQGEKRFEGLFGLFENGKVKFGVSQRDVIKGESLTKKDILFVDAEEAPKILKQYSSPSNISELKKALVELEQLLNKKISKEAMYQKFIEKNPWIFGAQYSRINPLNKFNDENIPDFTGIRIRDGSRDIIEIKQPFLPLFTKNNGLRSEFLKALDQCERYIDFTRNNDEYLRNEKGLNFANPKCYLLVGYNLDSQQLRKLRQKERVNQAFTIITFNDLLTMGQSTISFFESLYK